MTAQTIHTLKQTIVVLLLLSGAFSANAQLKYGFKTGLNFSRINGPSELNDAGEALEKWDNVIGFHIGMTFAYKFTDNFGVRGEALFSKHGGKYTFDDPKGGGGQSFRNFVHSTGTVYTTGKSRYLINVNNSYIDIPVMAFGRLGHFEFSGGAYMGILVQTSGEGSLRYTGTTALGNDVYIYPDKSMTELNFNINYSYSKDDPGAGAAKTDGEAPINVRVDGFVSPTPKTLGAYYDYPEGARQLYKGLDFGLIGGVSYYISSALYLGARLQYGLADITNQAGDLTKARLDANKQLIFRDDKDQNFVTQVFVGFGF